jgi:predicted metal-dependent phosphoesterase TrpH
MLIDLHLHTTASDGHCTPVELVQQARAAQLTIIAATDHDTTDAVADVQTAAAAQGIDAIAGIEITAIEDGRDVHVLGYFLDPDGDGLRQFLALQRAHRLERVREIAARLTAIGKPIAVEPILADARAYPTRSIGRPQVARAMIAAGYVSSIDEAFRSWLGHDAPAFVPRAGASPEAVIAIIHTSGGIASLAHPGRTGIDARLPALAAAGLDALEAFHTDHDDRARARYVDMAGTLGLLVTGGSDFHGDPAWPVAAGSTTLPPEHWARLLAACGRHRG